MAMNRVFHRNERKGRFNVNPLCVFAVKARPTLITQIPSHYNGTFPFVNRHKILSLIFQALFRMGRGITDPFGRFRDSHP